MATDVNLNGQAAVCDRTQPPTGTLPQTHAVPLMSTASDVDGVRQNTNPHLHAAPATRRTFDVDGQAVRPGALVEVDDDPTLVAIHPGLADGGVVSPVRPVDHAEAENKT